ncbi:hypothetical protein AVEN_133035-1 [Araneus ventricosus]|uniref:Uncharacterized protein n=1 Tax=Araneus ventricosus TaxID=182803 RepID=A0A4Y2QRM0_ARAVE|nr:hypothetical protein AVEN_133035-1 [Araneus ventricosus]
MKLVSVTPSLSCYKKIEPSSSSVLFKTFQNLRLSSLAPPFTLLVLLRGTVQKNLSQIHVILLSGAHPTSLLAPYLFLGLSFCRQRFLMPDNWTFSSRHSKSRRGAPDSIQLPFGVLMRTPR